jgi:hypothetical protein
LYDLGLNDAPRRDYLFHLYRLAQAQQTWFRTATGLPGPTHQESPLDPRNRALERWGLLRPGDPAPRLFSDYFADALRQQSEADPAFRDEILTQVKRHLSALELRILELFCQRPEEELQEADIQAACWEPADSAPQGHRAVYSAVSRVQGKLTDYDPYHIVGRIIKPGRGRGWILTILQRPS